MTIFQILVYQNFAARKKQRFFSRLQLWKHQTSLKFLMEGKKPEDTDENCFESRYKSKLLAVFGVFGPSES